MSECIFCKIVKNEMPCHKVWEDEKCLAFLDIHPVNPGHILIIPKIHEPDFENLSEELYLHVNKIAREFSQRLKANFNPKKVGIAVIGFDIAHTHLHVVPLHKASDITTEQIVTNNIANPSSEELQQILNILTK